jgi:hypothetical protein
MLCDTQGAECGINAAGGERPQKLSFSEQVVLCLFYFRQMPSFEILGMLFGISKTEANDTFHYWRKIIRDILTQVAGYQNPGAFHPEMSAIANDKLAVALRVTTILTQSSLSV